MGERNLYTLLRRGYFKEGKDSTDIFIELHPDPDFAPVIKQDVKFQMYLAKGDKIVDTDGRFRKKDGNVLGYKDIERMEVGDTMKVISNFTTEKSKETTEGYPMDNID